MTVEDKKDIPMPPLPEEEQVEQSEQIDGIPEKQPEESESTPQKQPSEAKETSEKINFAALRKEKERLEQENLEARRVINQYEKIAKPSNQEASSEEDLEINIGDDDLFEGKHYRKLQKQLKNQQDEMKKYQDQANLAATESKLKNQYSDFDKVVSEDNIRKLRETEPELAETISSTQDVYSKAVSAYKMIKKLGIYVEDSYEQDRSTAQKNSLKPKPLASVSPQQGESPLTKANAFANGLTPELKKQLWREMEESSKGY